MIRSAAVSTGKQNRAFYACGDQPAAEYDEQDHHQQVRLAYKTGISYPAACQGTDQVL